MNTKESEKVSEQNNQNDKPKQEEPKQNEEIQLVNEDKIAEIQAKADELNDKYLRLYSDFDNFRKRTAKEKIDLIQSAGENVFKSMLPVIDDFERAIKLNAELPDIKTINDGLNLITVNLKIHLRREGWKK